jgi:hypothetical protein
MLINVHNSRDDRVYLVLPEGLFYESDYRCEMGVHLMSLSLDWALEFSQVT